MTDQSSAGPEAPSGWTVVALGLLVACIGFGVLAAGGDDGDGGITTLAAIGGAVVLVGGIVAMVGAVAEGVVMGLARSASLRGQRRDPGR